MCTLQKRASLQLVSAASAALEAQNRRLRKMKCWHCPAVGLGASLTYSPQTPHATPRSNNTGENVQSYGELPVAIKVSLGRGFRLDVVLGRAATIVGSGERGDPRVVSGTARVSCCHDAPVPLNCQIRDQVMCHGIMGAVPSWAPGAWRRRWIVNCEL